MATKFLKSPNGGIYKDSNGKFIKVDLDGKLPLLVGVQSADNLYDITASDLDGVTELGDYAFYYRSGLRSVALPEECVSVGTNACGECQNLSAVDMPNVINVSNYGFNNCSLLVSVYMPKVASIGNSCFGYCTSLTTIDLPNVTSIGTNTFSNCANLETVVIPNVTELGTNTFVQCQNLSAVDMPNVTTIGANAFQNCQNLSSVSLTNVTSIGPNAFYSCTALTSVDMPNVISIGVGAFRRSSLSSALIGSACTSIANYAFYETKGGVITIEATTPPALGGTSAFKKGTKIIVPKGCGDTYKTATNWSSFADYIEEATA